MQRLTSILFALTALVMFAAFLFIVYIVSDVFFDVLFAIGRFANGI